MKTVFQIAGYLAHSEKDNFENGCIGKAKSEFRSGREFFVQADTFPALLTLLKDQFRGDDFLLYSEEPGRVDLQCQQREPFLLGRPSETTLAKFKAGEVDLWLTDYSFTVNIVQSEIDLSVYADEVKAAGISLTSD